MIGLLCYYYFIFHLDLELLLFPNYSSIWYLFGRLGSFSVSVIVLVRKRRNQFELSNIGRSEVINAKIGGWRWTTANKIGLTKLKSNPYFFLYHIFIFLWFCFIIIKACNMTIVYLTFFNSSTSSAFLFIF